MSENSKIEFVEEAFYQAALNDWRAAMAWLAFHEPEKYGKGANAAKAVSIRFKWDVDDNS
ncbi:MAG TPA: hypothetical protein VLS45_08345 [Methylomicrobium sp.]|nr:hypothetical protein [Methylomicrobium sp.]